MSGLPVLTDEQLKTVVAREMRRQEARMVTHKKRVKESLRLTFVNAAVVAIYLAVMIYAFHAPGWASWAFGASLWLYLQGNDRVLWKLKWGGE